MGIFRDRDAQKLRRIKQRKEGCFIQASSADEDDQDDEYDSKFSHYRNAQNLRRIKQRKGHCFIQESSDDKDDQDDDLIASIAIKISDLKCNCPKQAPLLKPV